MGVDRFRVDPTYRRIADGSVILGGAPLRLFRLSPGGQRVAAAIERGERLAGAHRPLTDRLSDAGAIQPEPATGPFTPADVTVVMPAHGALPLTSADPEASATIVVDDASAPAITAPAGVTVIRRTVNGGPGAARNTGLAAVTTPLVAFVDTDVRAAPGWMAALLVHFADERVAAVAPRVRAEPGDGLVARYEQGRSPLDLGPLADRVAVDGAAARGEDDLLHAGGGGRGTDPYRSQDVHLGVEDRVLDRPPHVDLRREMEDRVDLLLREEGVEAGGADVPPDEARLLRDAAKVARGEVVEDDDPVALGEDGVDEVRADEPGAARHEDGTVGRRGSGVGVHELPRE